LAGAEYEWGVHAAAFGTAVGLTDEQLAATATDDPDDPVWSDADKLLICLCDQPLELVIIYGWYRLLAGVINSLRIEREPWAPRFPVR
jgi:4-carboxymuconolactone decarboxylase